MVRHKPDRIDPRIGLVEGRVFARDRAKVEKDEAKAHQGRLGTVSVDPRPREVGYDECG